MSEEGHGAIAGGYSYREFGDDLGWGYRRNGGFEGRIVGMTVEEEMFVAAEAVQESWNGGGN